ncbi:hypothetical protein FAI41_03780 [Acetobacteraceae bacterium]|nr:hypothetical protein FAI41_03780 [Acetobacteraceae bacterium]
MMKLSSAFSLSSSEKSLPILSLGFLLAGFLSPALAENQQISSPSPLIDQKMIKRGDPVAEAEIDKRFNSNPNTRGLRNILYAYIPDLLKQCPTWDSEMRDWHRCEAVVPVADVVNFRNKLRKEPLNTRIQQWFFLDAIGGIERPNDDMVRVKSFLSKYFAKIILHELHDDNGWCYGPSWVGHSQKAWMPCAEIPPFETRTLPQWALYTPPKNHPRPTWPGTFDDSLPDEAGPMEVPAKIIEQAAKPTKPTGNLTKSYKGEDDNLASLPALPAHKAPIDPSVLLQRAEQIASSKDGAALLAQALDGNPAERQQALEQAAQTLNMSPAEVLQTAQALKSSPQGMLILQQIQQLASASPDERQQSLKQVAGMLGVKPQEAQQAAQNIADNLSQQAGKHPETTQQLLDQAKKFVADPQVIQHAKNALNAHTDTDTLKEVAQSPDGEEALSQVSNFIHNAQQENAQPSKEDLKQSDTGVFEIDAHDANRKEANAGGERDLLSYPHPDDDHPGIGEGNYGNMEDPNSKGAQFASHSASNTPQDEQNLHNPASAANNPNEDGIAPSSSHDVDMSDMSNMPESLPTPAQKTNYHNPSPFAGDETSSPQSEETNAQNETRRNTVASSNTAPENWQDEAFGGGQSANPYGNANFAPKQETAPPQGENSPPQHQNLGEIGEHTQGEAIVNGQKVVPQPYQKTQAPSPSQPIPAKTQKKKLKIITENDDNDSEDNNSEWKVIKR